MTLQSPLRVRIGGLRGPGVSSDFVIDLVKEADANGSAFMGGAGNGTASGDLNVGVGASALSAVGDGASNVAVGGGTLALNESGSQNSGVGAESLANLVSGDQNSGLGWRCLIAAEGDGNSAVGAEAAAGIVDGEDNTAVGKRAGYKIVDGDLNTFVGANSGDHDGQKTDAVNSTAIGAGAYTTADNQVAIGGPDTVETILRGEVKAGAGGERFLQIWDVTDNYFLSGAGPAAEPSGSGNHGVGLRALSSVTTGITNTAVGYEALMSATTTIDNTAVGSGALRVKTSGVGDSAFGKNALLRCTTGAGNTGIGDTALEHVTTGTNNVGVGYSAGRDNTTGNDNVAFGAYAGGGNAGVATTFSRCVSIGTETMNYNITGNDQVWIGYRAGHPSTGGQNTGVGSEAFRTITTGVGNVGVGYRVGNKITTGGACTFLGYQAGADNAQKADATNSTAIGYNSYTTKHNQIVFGDANITEVLLGGVLTPRSDNTQAIGTSSFRWSVVYAGTGSINTSDERAKQQIGAMPDAWLDAWGDVEWCRFKFNEAVAAKGEAARWHIGAIAQQVHAAFEARGLDAFEIGLCCFDEWAEDAAPLSEVVTTPTETITPAEYDEAGTMISAERVHRGELAELQATGEVRVLREAGDVWGLRYTECFAIEAAWQRRRMDRIEARLALLEAA